MTHHEKFDPEDFYLSAEGYIIFTEKYHLKRGYCCESGCRHCPWKNKDQKKKKSKEE
ncbi:MAG: hypothetical protein IPG90_07525 [Bacteroidetes bacterium]|nr:hypothetical protein [Bacteroidota bacterium]MBP6402226.1 hypothetical protein [Bacteroidia bacterium]MBK6838138.1 hypothetical protein [Bacteroidota bacterium]MBK9524996.1 hypothetical protein [Bacteroidota bacterium]MBK9543860.1 hypothetical protein [Bacteroidota bacterium]